MTRRSLISAAALISSALVATPAMAQSARPSLEVAGQTTLLRLNDSGTTSAGVGGRFSLDLSRWVSADVEVSFFPRDTFELATPTVTQGDLRVAYHRRRTDVLAGVKVGHRGQRFGVFGKVRPGMTRLTDKGIDCVGNMCALMLFVRPEYHNEFALDLGGIVEFYPSRRTVARFDFGDVLIRQRSSGVPSCSDCTSHNLTSRFGLGLRF